MSGLAWNRDWYRPGESLWSVANKVAFVACVGLEEVLEYLGGVVRQLREAWLFPTADYAASMCENLDLDFDTARGMVAGWSGLPDLVERARWLLAIRYCPICMAGFVHRTQFQDRSVSHCHVHRCALVGNCPHCLSPIDPLCRSAWLCNSCGQPIVIPVGYSFPQQFRTGPTGLLEPAPLAPPYARALHVLNGHDVNRRLEAQHVYEEHAVLTSVLLGQHLSCADDELDASASRGHSTFFDCPLAAAMLMSATQMGTQAQCCQGGWVPSRVHTSQAAGVQNLEVILGQHAPAEHEALARKLTRGWVSEALSAFVQAAESGKDLAVWRPSYDPRLNLNGARLAAVNLDQALLGLAMRASRTCRSKAVAAGRTAALYHADL